jgi:hypothetical protein
MAETGRRAAKASDLLPLALGVGALAVGTAFGWDSRLVDAVVTPPAILRAGLVAAAVVVGGALLVAALRRLGGEGEARDAAPRVIDGNGMRSMVRGVRLVFLAVAAFAAALGWVIGHPLPIVIALVIAGVDVIETSFLLLVVGRRRD